MTVKVGYLVDLTTVKFDEGSTQTWIQGAPLGKYDHPVYGEIEFTPERVQQFAANVKANVRGQDLNIDYDHKEGEAAGWVKDAEARDNGLWLLVEWTKTAAQKIKEKAYRYFSPEFVDEWTHPSTKQAYKDVLFGGGITNRPFLKGILPINMSEVFAHAADQNNDGGVMDEKLRKQIAKRLGLPEDAAEDQVLEALNKEPEAPPKIEEPPKDEEKEKEPIAASEASSEALKKLAEDNPVIKTLMETVEAQGVQLKEAAVDKQILKLSEKAAAKKFAIPPTTKDSWRELLLDAPKTLSEKLVKSFEAMIDNQLVSLSENGSSQGGDRKDKTGVQKFNDAVAELMEKDTKISYADATVRVAAEQPQLYSDYQAESYSGRE